MKKIIVGFLSNLSVILIPIALWFGLCSPFLLRATETILGYYTVLTLGVIVWGIIIIGLVYSFYKTGEDILSK